MNQISESYYYNGRPEMARFLPGQYAKVLEVGCGAGAFITSLQEDIEYWGVDPSESSELAMKTKCYRFLRGNLDDVAEQLPNQYFDLIVINDVMEHSVDHLAFLCTLKGKMATGGYLVGSVPNVRFVLNLKDLLLHRDWRYEASGGILDYTHLRFFTKKSLQGALRQVGFRIEICKGINPIWWSTYPSRIVLKRIFFGSIAMLIGQDVPYLQFAFRCRI